MTHHRERGKVHTLIFEIIHRQRITSEIKKMGCDKCGEQVQGDQVGVQGWSLQQQNTAMGWGLRSEPRGRKIFGSIDDICRFPWSGCSNRDLVSED